MGKDLQVYFRGAEGFRRHDEGVSSSIQFGANVDCLVLFLWIR